MSKHAACIADACMSKDPALAARIGREGQCLGSLGTGEPNPWRLFYRLVPIITRRTKIAKRAASDTFEPGLPVWARRVQENYVPSFQQAPSTWWWWNRWRWLHRLHRPVKVAACAQ